jgi:hypothetical protein
MKNTKKPKKDLKLYRLSYKMLCGGENMPQISLNIDQIIFEKIKKIAEQKRTSVSDWVEDNIKKTLGNDYPNDFFELFGAINDDTFIEPIEIDQRYDIQREQL